MSTINNLIGRKLTKIDNFSKNFHQIPPILGVILADQYGNTILVYEYNYEDSKNFGPIKSFLSDDDANLLEIDLISMYFSSFKTFAGQTNIKNLSHLEIHGSNIKAQIYFRFNDFMIINFLNSNTYFNSIEKQNIMNHFDKLIQNFEYELKNFNEEKSRSLLKSLKIKGNLWLKKVNRNYMKKRRGNYLKRHQILDNLMLNLENIIENEINEHLEQIPEEISINLAREIKNKIQDRMFDLMPNL
ncbi:MAG: hypothetical protein KGD63_00305 [Candidatus Lokiarchaeota archaeon]|nr:hypothetical protein [Candidatus Lokiarchaeota archaeon]